MGIGAQPHRTRLRAHERDGGPGDGIEDGAGAHGSGKVDLAELVRGRPVGAERVRDGIDGIVAERAVLAGAAGPQGAPPVQLERVLVGDQAALDRADRQGPSGDDARQGLRSAVHLQDAIGLLRARRRRSDDDRLAGGDVGDRGLIREAVLVSDAHQVANLQVGRLADPARAAGMIDIDGTGRVRN
jgi:hypothetical protein